MHMKATGEQTAEVPITDPSPPHTEEDSGKERRHRRRPARKPKQAMTQVLDVAGPSSHRSMPPMRADSGRLGAEVEAAGTSRSCPLLHTPFPMEARALVAGMGGGVPGRHYIHPHWPEQVVEEALKRGNTSVGKFCVKAHN